jgi:hypothetical protein
MVLSTVLGIFIRAKIPVKLLSKFKNLNGLKLLSLHCMKKAFFGAAIALQALGFCLENKPTQTFLLGNTPILLNTSSTTTSEPIIYLIHLHANEVTALEAGKQYQTKHGGMLVWLQHINQRNLSFELGGSRFMADPNRIFTATGRQQTLEKWSTYNLAADSALEKLSKAILHLMPNPFLIVALHNNTDGYYNIKSYLKNGQQAVDAAKIYHNPKLDSDDFVYTTNESIFNWYKQHKINVVLQHKLNSKDDGSFSIYCGQQNLDYINIEAQFGHLEQQLQMLELLHSYTQKILKEKTRP